MIWLGLLILFSGFYFFARGLWLGGGWLFFYVILSLPYLLTGLDIFEGL